MIVNFDSVGIYLAANVARHPNFNIIYQDIEQNKFFTDLGGDMLQVDLSPFDYIIATPPCNFWSKLNYQYLSSKYALATKHLLPDTIKLLSKLNKPFIIENVKNISRFEEYGIIDLIKACNLNAYYVGRHIYITNVECPLIKLIPQQQDFKYGGKRVNNDGYNQGGTNVHNVIECWLNFIHFNEFSKVYKPHQLTIFDYLYDF